MITRRELLFGATALTACAGLVIPLAIANDVWSTPTDKSFSSIGVFGPYTDNGDMFIVWREEPVDPDDWCDGIKISISKDGGETWDEPVPL